MFISNQTTYNNPSNILKMSHQQQLYTEPDFRQTFGNQTHPHLRTPTIPSHSDPSREQTRIKLLASFQQSYLNHNQRDIKSQAFYTENIPSSYLQSQADNSEDSYKFLTSHSKSKSKNNIENINREVLQPFKSIQVHNQEKISIKQFRQDLCIQQLEQKVENLRRGILDQLFIIKLEDEIYSFLTHKIDKGIKCIKKGNEEHNRDKKMKNSDILQENAIEFMDKAEQFVNEFRKLQSMLGGDMRIQKQ